MKISIIKRLFGDLIAGAVAVLLICLALTAPYQVEVHASAPGPAAYTAPANGAGRVENSEFGIRNEGKNMIAFKPDGKGGFKDCRFIEEDGTETALPDIFGGNNEEREPSACADAVVVEVIPEAAPVIESDIDALIVEAAERYGLPWQLVSAVVWAESRYNPDAISGTPDYGLMQVTASVCAAYGLTSENRLDPAANLDAGCRILREKIDESDGDFTIALMKYNEGDTGYLENIAAGIRSTKYTEDVLGKYYQILREG